MNWRRFLQRDQADAEQRHELESYVELTAHEYIARGMEPNEARLAAQRRLGNTTLIREEVYRMNTVGIVDTLTRNLRQALRALRRNPMFATVTLLTLALGIGANTAIFSVVNGVLLKPLPYPDADRLITMSHSAPGVNIPNVASAPFLYFTEREQNRTLEGVGLLGQGTATVTGSAEPEQVQRLLVTSDILPILGIPPLLGRYFSASDDSPGSPNTVVLTFGYWQRRFGGDASAVGQRLILDGTPWTIIGVMPPRFRSLDRPADLITPFRLDRSRVTLGNYFRRSIARLKPGVTLEQASADVNRMIPLAIDGFPVAPGATRQQTENSRLGPNLKPLKEVLVGNAKNTLWVLMGTVGMVLLIACANVANLILVRNEGRQHELSLRAALGAGWGRLARELLTESTILGLIGGAIGVGFAYAGLRTLLAAAPANLPRVGEIAVDSTVLLFAVGLSLMSGLLFGLISAIRYAKPRLMLSAGGRSMSATRERLRARGVLVVAQVALALVLLICAGLMLRTFQELNRVTPGFADGETIQTVRITIPQASAREPEQMARRQQEILNRIAAVPGVTSAAYISDAPMDGGQSADLVVPEGKTFRPGEPPRSAQSRFVSPRGVRDSGPFDGERTRPYLGGCVRETTSGSGFREPGSA